MEKQFSFVKNKNDFNNYQNTMQSNEFRLFLKRFFNSKINWFLFGSLVLIFFALIICVIFSKYSWNTAVLDSKYAYNLPSFFNPKITVSVKPNYELSNLQAMENYGEFKIEKIQYVNDLARVTFNPYKLIQAIQIYNQEKPEQLMTFFGTNNLGIDNFSFFNYSFFITILIAFSSALASLIFSSILACYTQWFFSKIQNFSNNLILSIALLPSLIVAILFFNLFGYSHAKAFWILFIISIPNFYFSCLVKAKAIYNSDYIKAYIVSGLSSNQIIWKITFWQILKFNFALVSDQMSLSITILAALSFFNVSGILQNANIGNVFKGVIDNFQNYAFSLYVIISTIIFILLLKLNSIKLFIAWNPELN